ncbi:hypothetical protein H8356DRAFT_1288799 [Neocallimastix lanati (nom. inval.)]|uniref:Uncharacterized protein n=1 Tax=Neocallimastix californiae TaxID=1754190 RepID=A0A1Y2CJR2_9FUNG|nr:hypothetical protein H8356DRAFT_1288799 [Neocallimastix sp. JGI-2020a]ORY47167.1 hypothetical protein LY90DRAFT_509129 [Neocallimastix californiae]|eukprot:ORY47167.1 hypothetical protein LY90DRAFT_509129 [Neocallimastix californiae]
MIMEGFKDKNDILTQEIESRVENVEGYLVDIQSAIGSKYLKKELTKGKPLLYRIDNIERSINQIIKSNKLDELFSKYNINDKIKTSAIDIDAKLDIILLSEKELIDVSNKVEEIKSLQQYINSKEYTKIEELLPQFTTERLSEIFIWYNNILTEIELKILELERIKKDSN